MTLPGAGGRSFRSGRTRGAPDGAPVVAVTGAASPTGLLLTRHLLTRDDVARVIAIDAVRADAPGATWRLADVAAPEVAARLRGVDVVVHLAEGRAERPTVLAAQAVLTGAAAAGVARVVVCTSAMVYGALPDNPVPLPEDAPLRALPERSALGRLLEVEDVCARAGLAHRGLTVTVVRPATVVGDGRASAVTRHFEGARLLTVRGAEPLWQLCHVEDLVTALATAAVEPTLTGPLTVACEGWLDQAGAEALSGLRRVELPPSLVLGAAERLHRLGVVSAPASELPYVLYPWVVDSARLRAAGWRPAYENAAVLAELVACSRAQHAARGMSRTDATIGAAGATVAALGTAALVRRARRRRGT